jgi:formate hydrogenlyase subunit 4
VRADVFVGVLMEPLQVMSFLLEALVQVFVLLLKVKALLKVAELFSLLSPLTRTQTTMPQTRPGGA